MEEGVHPAPGLGITIRPLREKQPQEPVVLGDIFQAFKASARVLLTGPEAAQLQQFTFAEFCVEVSMQFGSKQKGQGFRRRTSFIILWVSSFPWFKVFCNIQNST